MKRFQLLVIMSTIAAGLVWLGFYRSRHTSSAAVTALLPKNTLAFVHMPDFNRSRTEFYQTDLYQIWAEPAVQDFLQKPRAKISSKKNFGSILQDCETLQMKDAFIALLNIESGAWKMVAGFRFKGDSETAEKIVANWKPKLFGDELDVKKEALDYHGHQIRVESEGILRLATVHDGQWFFIANDSELLKPLLDRVDRRVQDPSVTLDADEAFVAASRRMPSIYVTLAFAHIDQLIERLTPRTEKEGNEAVNHLAAIRQVRSLCGATSFDGGRIRDTIFVGMPRLLDEGNLTRASLPIATTDTFLYAAGFLNLTRPLPLPGSQGALGWLAGLQKIMDAMALHGITLEDWNSAFGPELSWIGEWPANAHWPSLFATLPVKDPTKANKILSIITTADEDSIYWKHREKGGVQYFSTRSGGELFSLSPTIALSNQILVAGADAASVESAMKRSANGNSELATSKIFRNAEYTLPTAKQAFTYIDPALIYTRVDATLRPIFLWSAAFLPGITDTVDLNKLPLPEVVTKHLSPIVMSQSYDGDGYIAESVGPMTFGQTIVGVGGLGGIAAILYQHQTQRQTRGPTDPSVVAGVASSSVSPSTTLDKSTE